MSFPVLFGVLALLTVVGYFLGRSRAMATAGGHARNLHSLPNYYGYYLALWTGLPAFILLALYGLFGASLVNTLALGELEREAAPLIREYEAQLARDPEYQALAEETLQILGVVEPGANLSVVGE